jgi:hypothetical protein
MNSCQRSLSWRLDVSGLGKQPGQGQCGREKADIFAGKFMDDVK